MLNDAGSVSREFTQRQYELCSNSHIDASRQARAERGIDVIQSAAYDTVHCAPGKASQLAAVLSKAPHSILNEVNPNVAGSKFGLLDAARVMSATYDYSILHALGMHLNHTCIYLGDYAGVADAELLETYANFHREVGDMAKEVSAAIADRVVTHDEVQRIKKEGAEMIRMHFAFIARLEAIAE